MQKLFIIIKSSNKLKFIVYRMIKTYKPTTFSNKANKKH